MRYFAVRNLKEMLRDRLTLFFGLVFPLIILVLLYILNLNIPTAAGMTLFELENLAPGIAVFGLSFIALFGGMDGAAAASARSECDYVLSLK